MIFIKTIYLDLINITQKHKFGNRDTTILIQLFNSPRERYKYK